MNEVRMQWLRPSEILAKQAEKSIVYLPIGPLEWHGPHLPLGTDALEAERVSIALAQQIGGVVYPTLFWGTERERSPELVQCIGFRGDEWIVGMDFPANSMRSYYTPEEQFACTVRWTLEGLIAHGYRLIIVANGHGATDQHYHLQRLVAELNAGGPARLLYLYVWSGAIKEESPGHACITETSAMLSLKADRVDLNGLLARPGPLRNVEWAIIDDPTFYLKPTPDHTVRPEADPRWASAELGEQYFIATVERFAKIVNDTWARLA